MRGWVTVHWSRTKAEMPDCIFYNFWTHLWGVEVRVRGLELQSGLGLSIEAGLGLVLR